MQVDIRESWWIRDIEIPTRLLLAPMAGVSVQAFRRQGRRYGAGLVCSEMVSCAGLEHRNERTLGYLRVARDEHPLAIQIFGSEPAVMAGRAAQGNPWALSEIVEGDGAAPSREEVAAELIVFVRETMRELGERRASGFLKKFYGWYLGRGRFPKPFKQEVVQLESTEDVVTRLLAAAPGAAAIVERLEAELPDPADEILLDSMPISIYGGG